MTNSPAAPRHDGRTCDALRPTEITIDFVEAPLASALIRAGRTTVLCTASLERPPRWLQAQDDTKGWVTAEYAMLPGSTQERSRRERSRVGGRTMEIQRLIGRSLRAVCDLSALGPRQLTLDCDVLQADGGTRTASITGAFVALALACGRLEERGELTQWPLREAVAAVSCGVVGGRVLLDLPYVEDVAAEVDMNVVMTGSGRFVEIQGTGEETTFSEEQLHDMLALARTGIAELVSRQMDALPPKVAVKFG